LHIIERAVQGTESALAENGEPYSTQPFYRDFHAGEVLHSQADISKAACKQGYAPKYRIMDGIVKAMSWYVKSVVK